MPIVSSRTIRRTLTLAAILSHMVDKVWYDRQNSHPDNFWAFFGGTIQATQNVSYYEQYPNGGPPFLSVSLLLCFPIALPDLQTILHR